MPNLTVASMFMTGMAANPLVSKAAMDVFGVEFGWSTWILGSIVPGLVALLLLPLLLHKLTKPTIKDGSAAQIEAKNKLREMGPITRNEKIMFVVLLLLLLLWTTKFNSWYGHYSCRIYRCCSLAIIKCAIME